MKKLLFLIITIVALLTPKISLGQVTEQPLPGQGTSGDPYRIESAKKWREFVEYINSSTGGEYFYAGKYIKLNTDNIKADSAATVSVGNADAWFAGNFDGDGREIELHMTGSNVALFNYVDSGDDRKTIEIKNLTVKGSITTTEPYAAGFVSQVWRKLRFTSCTSSVTISNLADYINIYAGGFVGLMAKSTTVTCKYCVFDGIIDADLAYVCAGYIGLIQSKCTLAIHESTQAYKRIVCQDVKTFYHIEDGATSVRIDVGTNSNICYFLPVDASWNNIHGSKVVGREAPDTPVDGFISKKYVKNEQSYYVPQAHVSGMATYYTEDPNPSVPLNPAPVVTYYGKELTNGTHYTYYVDVENDEVVFDAKDGNGVYFGTGYAIGYNIVEVNDWGELNDILQTSTDSPKVLKLQRTEYIADAKDTQLTIEGSGAVTLYMNGCVLNRNLTDSVDNGSVIFIGKTADVTIIGDGETEDGNIITGGNNNGAGGGIRCNGKLTLKNVTIKNNEAHYISDKDYGTGGGVYCSGSLHIEGGDMSYNRSHGGGGGVNSTGSHCYIKGVHFHNNFCNSKGGGIRVKTNNAVIEDCIVENNQLMENANLASASDGGGIHNDGSDPVTIRNCTIFGNNAYRWGGGIYSIGGTVYAEGCTIQRNTSSENGGGIFVNAGSFTLSDYEDEETGDIYGTDVSENVSNNTGGVFVAAGSNLYVSGTIVIKNNVGTAIRQNLFFASDSGVMNVIDGDLKVGSMIGISRNKAGTITKGLDMASIAVKESITSDNYLNYWVLRSDGTDVALAASFDWSKPTKTEGDNKYWRLKDDPATNWVTYNGSDKSYDIKAPIIIPTGTKYDANSITISGAGHIFIQNGGELLCATASVPVSVMKEITAAAKDDKVYGWTVISSPVTEALLTGADANVNIVTANSEPYNFDLLCYDEPNHYWRSYTSPTSGTYFGGTLQVAKGYLYRNMKNFTAEFDGNTNHSDVPVTLSASCELEKARGFNLIGNPYTHDIYIGDGCAIPADNINGYYLYDSKGGWEAVTEADPMPVKSCEGALVQVSETVTVTMKNTDAAPAGSGEKYQNDNIKFIASNDNYRDATYAVFKKGNGLNKIDHVNPDIPMVYISYKDEDFAIAKFGDEVKSFNLNFKAKTIGSYTLSYETTGEYNYLHIIDRLTGKDIDMLETKEYSFIASPSDTDARFIVNLQYKPNYDDGIFAYQSGNDIVVSGEGELQVFDVLGRFVTSRHINGVETVNVNAAGVYVLRIVGDEILTQKVVVK